MRKALLSAIALSLFTTFSLPGIAAEPVEQAAVVATVANVNLNTADAATLSEALDGVGAAKAQAIVEYREAHGAFTSVDDLLEVKGIGPVTLEKNRARLTVQ